MKNFKSCENVRVEVSYTPEEMLFLFKKGQEFVKINPDKKAFEMNVFFGKKFYEDNKHMVSDLENMIGHKIVSSEDLVALSLTMQMLVFQEKMNEMIYGGIR